MYVCIKSVSIFLDLSLIRSNKVTQEIWACALKENVMKETFEQEHLERKVTGVKASIPSLSLLQQTPACDGIGQMLHFVLFGYCKRTHIGYHRCATFVRLGHLFGEFFKVTVTLPDSNRISNASFSINNKELSILAMFL
jgi:hypothetical protein